MTKSPWCVKGKHEWEEPDEEDTLCYECILNREQAAAVHALEDELRELRIKVEAQKKIMDLVAEDALWHDGLDNPEALEDIRKIVKSLGYTKESVRTE